MTIGYFLAYAIVAIVAGFFLMAPVAFVFDRIALAGFQCLGVDAL